MASSIQSDTPYICLLCLSESIQTQESLEILLDVYDGGNDDQRGRWPWKMFVVVNSAVGFESYFPLLILTVIRMTGARFYF